MGSVEGHVHYAVTSVAQDVYSDVSEVVVTVISCKHGLCGHTSSELALKYGLQRPPPLWKLRRTEPGKWQLFRWTGLPHGYTNWMTYSSFAEAQNEWTKD